MISLRTSTVALFLGAAAMLGGSTAGAQAPLGWTTFDYGVSGTLGPSIILYDGALNITGRTDIFSPYSASGSLLNGMAASIAYLHDDNWLVGGIGTSLAGIRGNAGSASELVFDLQGSARLDGLALAISGLVFGSSAYEQGFNLSGDDPMLWLNTDAGVFTITEEQIAAATSFFIDGSAAGAQNGYVDFAYFTTALGEDTMVTSFGLRETLGDIWVKDLYIGDYTAAPVPEPGSAIMLGAGVFLLLQRRRNAPRPLSSQLAVV